MSILDGMYWENQIRGINKTATKNELEQDKFNNKMPCNSCNINDICSHAFSIKCSHYNTSLFEIEIKCKRYIQK